MAQMSKSHHADNSEQWTDLWQEHYNSNPYQIASWVVAKFLECRQEGCSSGGVLDSFNVRLHVNATFCLFTHMISQDRYKSTPDQTSEEAVQSSKNVGCLSGGFIDAET